MEELESTGVAFEEAQRQNGQVYVLWLHWFSVVSARLLHDLKEQDDNRMRIVNGLHSQMMKIDNNSTEKINCDRRVAYLENERKLLGDKIALLNVEVSKKVWAHLWR